MSDEKPIYLDMDGVLADFDGQYDRLIGRRTAEGQVMWDEVARYPNFFLDLPLLQGARELWAAVPKGRRRILSGFPKEIDYAAAQKRQWLKRNNFEIDEDRVVLVPGRREKRAYARPGHILIDDWRPVIFAWEDGGGTGIWYRNVEQAIEDLKWCISCLDIPEEEGTRRLAENAARLGLDEVRVEDRSLENRVTKFGVVLVAGHGFAGVAGAELAKWGAEVRSITQGKVAIDTAAAHSTIGNICRSQPEKIDDSRLKGLNLDRVVKAIRDCREFDVQFNQIRLGQNRNGNITLIGQARGTQLAKLRRAFKAARLPLDGEFENPFVSLAHISSQTLRCLAPDEADTLKGWIEAHSRLDEPVVYSVREIKVVCYRRRRLDSVQAHDCILPLGRPSVKDGNELREIILRMCAGD